MKPTRNRGDAEAFPVSPENAVLEFGEGVYRWGGLTVREYFAAQALAGIMANRIMFCPTDVSSETLFYQPQELARWAVEHADALLRELGAE